MIELLHVTDRSKRVRQHLCIFAAAALVTAAVLGGAADLVHPIAALVLVSLAIVVGVIGARIKQRWEVEHNGHRIRFENGALSSGERLYLDDRLVARGGLGSKTELRAAIGDGTRDVIVAQVTAGLLSFRLRLFISNTG